MVNPFFIESIVSFDGYKSTLAVIFSSTLRVKDTFLMPILG